MIKRNTIDPLLTIRGFSAIIILLSHMQHPGIHFETRFGIIPRWMLFADGHLFVWVFFILSGYLIGKGYFTNRYTFSLRSIAKFVRRRIIRIAPLYYLFVALNVWLLKMWRNVDFDASIVKVLVFNGSSLIFQNGFSYLWAISNEVRWYVIAPMVCFLLLKVFKIKKVFGIILMVLIVIIDTAFRHYAFTIYSPKFIYEYMPKMMTPFVFSINFFLFGLTVNYLVSKKNFSIDKNTDNNRWLWNFVIKLMAIIGVLILYIYSSKINYFVSIRRSEYIYTKAVILPLMTMVVLGFYIYATECKVYWQSFTLYRKAKKSIFVFLNPAYLLSLIGIISYEFYLVHLPLMNYYGLHCTGKKGCLTAEFIYKFSLLLFLSLMYSWLLYKFYPILIQFIKRKLTSLITFSITRS